MAEIFSATMNSDQTPDSHAVSYQSALSTQAPSRKRKRAPATAPSPFPSEHSNGNNPSANPIELTSIRADLSSRPQLSISRGPVFVSSEDGCEYFKTDLVAVNRLGFRYIPAGINPLGHILPCRTIESNPASYRISWEDRSSSITVTKDGLGLRGESGFRSARCNAPITEGCWYLEVKIIQGGGEHMTDGPFEGSHVRVGWGRREAPLNGPVGLDGYSYGYRDKTGDKVTLSRPKSYGQAYGSGDTIGLYISLPLRRKADGKDANDPAHIKRERIPIDLKGQEVFEILEYPQSKEMIALMDDSAIENKKLPVPYAPKKPAIGKLNDRNGISNVSRAMVDQCRPLSVLHGSRIAFFLNGKSQGIAFKNIYDFLQLRKSDISCKGKEKKRVRDGVKEHRVNPFNDGTLGYYPFISLFNDARVRLNPGPHFDFPPPLDIDAFLDDRESDSTVQQWRPVCERYAEFMEEQWALDALEEEEALNESRRIEALERIETYKKAERSNKRQHSQGSKRMKLGLPEPPNVEVGVSTPSIGLGQPLVGQQTTCEEMDELRDSSHSPAHTLVSNGDFQGHHSGYNSDTNNLEV